MKWLRTLTFLLMYCLFSSSIWGESTPPIDPPIPNSNAPICVGSGTALMLFTNPPTTGGPYTFSWSGPSGFSSFVENPIISNPQAINSGLYSVVISDGASTAVGNTTVVITPTPNQPAITAPTNIICEGEDIQLSGPTYSGAFVVYEWTGPFGVIPGNNNPIYQVNFADANDAGDYTMQVMVDGCPSAVSAAFNLTVNPLPAAPVPTNNGPICDKETLQLFANIGGLATYEWTGPGGFVSFDQNPTLPNAAPANSGLYSLEVKTAGGCSNFGSTNVEILEVPSRPEVSATSTNICLGGNTTLSTFPYVGTTVVYQWTGPSGIIPGATTETLLLDPITQADAGSYEVIVSVDGCTSLPSNPFTVAVSNPTDIADAGPDVMMCGGTSIDLAAIAATGMGTSGSWTQSASQDAEGVIIVDPTDPNSSIIGMSTGNSYEFIWTLTDLGCGDYDSDIVTITLDEAPSDVAFAGQDVFSCGSTSITLDANSPSIGTGMWTSATTGATISNPNFSETLVSGLTQGENTFYWSLSNGQCADYSVDSIIVTVELGPEAFSDTDSTGRGIQIDDINVLDNDNITTLSGNWSVNITEEPENGTLTNNQDGTFDYLPNSSFVGTDQFSYEVCSDNCPALCSSADVLLTITGERECLPPTVFTPNDDGANDTFEIYCLGFYPDSKITVFNRWGDQVFTEQPYSNNWDGSYNGGDLPVGTYYYILELNNASSEKIQGYLMLSR